MNYNSSDDGFEIKSKYKVKLNRLSGGNGGSGGDVPDPLQKTIAVHLATLYVSMTKHGQVLE